jgi:PIN domain nuclease of toxin-antitoxin system
MTSILLDSHAFLWFLWDDQRLSQDAKAQIENANNRKLVSIASCWEIAIKARLRKLDLGEAASSYLPREIAKNHFELLPISLDHATMVEKLAHHHRDPFDRLLVAQAIIEGTPLASTDTIFDQYGIARIW